MQKIKAQLNIRKTALAIALFFALGLVGFFVNGNAKAAAGINKQINYQGKLTNTSGVSVADGNYDMVFSFYTVASGGSAVWTGNHTAANGNPVAVAGGVFATILGSGTGNAISLDFSQDTYYLGVTVGTDAEMTPRKRITSVPQAFNANNLVGDGFVKITGAPAGSGVDQGTVYVNPTTATAGYTLMGLAVGGVQKFKIDEAGNLTATGMATVGTLGTTNNSNLLCRNSSNQLAACNAVGATQGGTGQTVYAVGDLLYASTTTALSRLADVATGNVLLSGGVGVAPSWGKVGLTTHVSGTLGVGNGGTGTATAFTQGSIVFAGASGIYSQDNANFFWDNTNKRLGIGTNVPSAKFGIYMTGTENGIYARTDGTGNLLTLNSSGTDILNISPTQASFNVPTSFTAAGDVSLAYDMIFTNQMASNIKTNSPFTIEVGELYESNDLTLRTYNAGGLVLDTPGGMTLMQAQAWNLATSTTALNVASGLLNVDTTNRRVGIGTTSPASTLHINGGYMTITRPQYAKFSLESTDSAKAWNFENSFGSFIITDATLGLSRLAISGTNGNVGIGTTSPTAYLHIKAGTATLNTAPIKLTSGINLTTPEAGAFEYDGTELYFTPGASRETIAYLSDITAASHNPVTLTGQNYLSIDASQQITVGQINLAGTHITGILGSANGGTGIDTSALSGVPTISAGSWSVGASLGVTLGGTGTTTQFTPGSIVFAGTNGVYSQDNANFFWDDTNKRLGIGTASPAEALEVNGKIKVGNNTVAGENFTFTDTAPGLRMQNQYGYVNLTPLNSGWMHFYTDRNNFIFNKSVYVIGGKFASYNTDNLTLSSGGIRSDLFIQNSTGNIGIGTTTPTANFQVAQSTAGVGTVSNTAGGTTVTGTGTQFTNTFKVGDTITIGGQTVAISAIASDTSMTTAAITNANTNATYTLIGGTRLSVLGNGNVGIGMNPSATLEIKGSVPGTGSGNNFALYDSGGTVRSFIRGNGGQYWYLNNGSGEVGSIAYSTPNAMPGIVFFDSAGNSRSDFRQLSGGGFVWAATSGSSLPPELMRLNASGNLGIGTVNPSYALHIAPTAGLTAGQTMFLQDATATTGATKLIVKAGAGQGTTNLQEWVSSAGNVIGGIDTTGKLFTNMDGGTNYRFTLDASNGGGPRLSLGTLGSPNLYFDLGAWSSINNFDSKTRDLKLYNAGGYIYLQNSTGNVGIGTSSPLKKLSILASDASLVIGKSTSGIDILNTSSGIGKLNDISFLNSADTDANRFAAISGIVTGQGSGTYGSIIFSTKSLVADTALSERMRINHLGNVGIGDTTPASLFTVGNGDLFQINASGQVVAGAWNGTAVGAQYGGTGINTSASTGVPTISSGTWSVGASLGVTLGGTGTTTQFTPGSIVFAGTNGVYSQDNANFFWDNTNKRLGIGTASPGYKLDVNGDVRVTGAAYTSGGGAGGVGVNPFSTTNYVQSRGMNLITNGSGLLGNNYNFSAFTFDQTDTYGGKGSFRNSTYSASARSDEAIPVDGTKTYKLSVWAKSTTHATGAHAYFGLVTLDIDGNDVAPYTYMKFPGSTDTTLAVQLNPGDTTVTVTNAAGWNNAGSGHARNFAWYGYANSFGYVYPDYTYTRNSSFNYADFSTNGAWAAGGVSGNVITLRSAWTGPTIPAGASIRNNQSGGSYKYIAAGNVDIPNSWTNYSGIIGGWNTTGADISYLFPYGTAYVKLLFLLNRDVAGNVTNVSNLWFSELTANNLELASATQQGLVSLSNQQMGTGDKYFMGNVGIGTTSPNSMLDVYAASGGVMRMSSNNATSYGSLRFSSNNASYLNYGATIESTGEGIGVDVGNLIFKTGSGVVPTERLRIAANGNVGIGTTSPVSTLDINGNATLVHTGGIMFNTYYSGGWKYKGNGFGNSMVQSNGGLLFSTFANNTGGAGVSATENARMIIAVDGNVGIGDTTPASLFTVGNGDLFQINASGQVVAGAWNGTAIGAQYGGTGINTSASTGVPTISAGTWSVGASLGVTLGGTGTTTQFTPGSIVFAGTNGVYSQDNANFFWDDTNKRLGIGTASPGASLDIQGTSVVYAKIKSTTNTGASAYQAINDVANTIEFGRYGSTRSAYGVIGSGDAYVYSLNGSFSIAADSASGIIKFGTGTGNPERMRIDSAGKVGIGTTPGTNQLFTVGSGNVGTVNYNGYYTSGAFNTYQRFGNWDAIGSDSATATKLRFGGYTGSQWSELALFTSGSQRVTIDTNGNVGIGDTTPASLFTVGNGDLFQINASGQVVAGAWNGTAVGAQYGGTGINTSASTGVPTISSGTWSVGASLGVTLGGTGTTTQFTQGSIVFAGASGVYSQDNANFFWDNTNKRLGIGTASPAEKLDVRGKGVFQNGYISLILGADNNGTTDTTTLTNNLNKMGRIVAPHYQNATAKFGAIGINSNFYAGIGYNTLYLGSAGSFTTAATEITFTTAADYNVLGGTERMRIDRNGNVGIGTVNPFNLLTINQQSAANKQSLFSLDNMQLSQLEGGAYFGSVGIRENQWGLNNHGNTWTAKESNRNWQAIEMSSDGKLQTAVVSGGFIYTSSDYGNNWTQKDSARNWFGIAMSSDGKIQTASAYGGQIYVSTDYGSTWAPKDSARNWRGVAMSSDGKIQTVVVNAGQIYVSTDFGNTWNAKDSSRQWYEVAMSSDGKIQTAFILNGALYISTDYGSTWSVKDSGTSRWWNGIAMSSDGKIQTAVITNNNQIRISYDYGNNWAFKGPVLNWYGIAMSSDGKNQTAVAYSGQIYVSSDYGNSWVAKDSSRAWFDVAMSSDGKVQAALDQTPGKIYVSHADSYQYGNLGIGTASPQAPLHIVDTGTASSFRIDNTNASGYEGFNMYNEGGVLAFSFAHSNSSAAALPGSSWMGTRNNESLHFTTNGIDPRMTINSVGNVGIGDTSPTALFTVGNGDLFQINGFGQVMAGSWYGTAIGAQYGGTGINTSASTGVPTISAGTWSVGASLGVTLGGTGTTTQFTPGSIVFAGTNGVYSQDNANFFWDSTNHYLKLGSVPYSLGIDTTDNNKFKIFQGDGIAGTNTFSIDTNGVTTIASLNMGTQEFQANSGAISWIDMPVTNSAANNTVESYTAQLDGNPMITVYGQSDGAGGIKNSGVGIGTANPAYRLDVTGGFFRTTYNTTALPSSDNTNGGLAVGFNYSGGGAESNFYNLYDNASRGFVFSQKTGASTKNDIMTLYGSSATGVIAEFNGFGSSEGTVSINHASNTQLTLKNAGTSSWSLASYKPWSETNPSLSFYNQRLSSDAFFINGDTNNVGVRNTQPGAMFSVNTNVALSTTGLMVEGYSDTIPLMQLGASSLVYTKFMRTSGNVMKMVTANYGGASFSFEGNYDFTGDVGIGTTSPSYPLSVYKAATGATVYIGSGTDGAVAQNRFEGTTAVGASRAWGSGLNVSDGNGGYGIYDYTAAASRMYINTSGNMGIGTISPTGKLHSYVSSAAVTATTYDGIFENFATNTTTDAINKYGVHVTSTGSFTGSTGTATNNVGVYISTTSGADTNYDIYAQSGAHLTTAGTWTNAPSYRRYKGNYSDTTSYLDKLMNLDVYEWQYKDENIDGINRYTDDQSRHASPFLDDFYNTFHLGTIEGYNIQDLAGVSIASIKELNQRFINKGKVLDDNITVLNLKTDQNVTTLSQLQASVDSQLTTIQSKFTAYDSQLADMQTKLNNDYARLGGIDTTIATLQAQMDELKTRTDSDLLMAKVDLHEQDIAYLKMVLGFDRVINPGDVDILGKLKAEIVEGNKLVITVKDEESRTIGQATILKIQKDDDGNGIDDVTGSDGKSVLVNAATVENDSKIFTSFAKNPGSFSWVEKEIDQSTGTPTGFRIFVNQSVIDDVIVDWWIVQIKN